MDSEVWIRNQKFDSMHGALRERALTCNMGRH